MKSRDVAWILQREQTVEIACLLPLTREGGRYGEADRSWGLRQWGTALHRAGQPRGRMAGGDHLRGARGYTNGGRSPPAGATLGAGSDRRVTAPCRRSTPAHGHLRGGGLAPLDETE